MDTFAFPVTLTSGVVASHSFMLQTVGPPSHVLLQLEAANAVVDMGYQRHISVAPLVSGENKLINQLAPDKPRSLAPATRTALETQKLWKTRLQHFAVIEASKREAVALARIQRREHWAEQRRVAHRIRHAEKKAGTYVPKKGGKKRAVHQGQAASPDELSLTIPERPSTPLESVTGNASSSRAVEITHRMIKSPSSPKSALPYRKSRTPARKDSDIRSFFT